MTVTAEGAEGARCDSRQPRGDRWLMAPGAI